MSDFTWATVTQLSPLRIRIDGDTAALVLTPESLVDVAALAVSSRVRVELYDRRILIVGLAGGPAPTVEVPAGIIAPTARSSAPTGWLLCDGSAVSRTTYAALFTAIGTTFGSGNGSTTFNVPNLKGRIPVGIDTGQTEFDVRGETGGAKTHTLTTAEMPAHTHPNPASGQFWIGGGSAIFAGGSTYSGTLSAVTGSSTGGGGAHNNLQPYMALHYLIKT